MKGSEAPYVPFYVGRPYVAALTCVQVAMWAAVSWLLSWASPQKTPLPWHVVRMRVCPQCGRHLHLSSMQVLLSVYVCEVLANLTHWLGHRNVIPWWYTAHVLGHHVEDYSARRFLTSAYEPARSDNSKPYAVSLVVAPLLVCAVLPGCWSWYAYTVSFACCYAMLLIADAIHMALHTRNHPWEAYEWFRNLRALHYWHHAGDMKRNYAIGDFFLDWMLLGIHF